MACLCVFISLWRLPCHLKLTKLICFSPVNLLYVSLIIRPSHKTLKFASPTCVEKKNIGSPYHFPKNTMLYIIKKCFVSSTSVPLFMLLFFLKQFFAEMGLTLVHSVYPPTQLNYYKANPTLKYFCVLGEGFLSGSWTCTTQHSCSFLHINWLWISCRSFMVSGLILRSLIHLGLIFV